MNLHITGSKLDGRLVATNKRWSEKWVRVAHILGLINTVEYEVLATIKDAMPVQELLRHAAPADLDAFTSTILRLAAHGSITLEQPQRDETPGLVNATRTWEQTSLLP